jgi:penicillin-binding protein 1A
MKNKKKHTKKKQGKFAKASTGKKLLMVLGGLFALGVAVVLVTVVITAVRVGKINQDSLYSNIERSSILYDIKGTEIDTLHYTEDREIVPVSEMPEDLINAFIAIEDKTFYKHHGFN